MPVVTMHELKTALRHRLGKRGMTRQQIEELAETILGFFGFDDFVVDNRLSSNERDIFYMLEEEGFLTTMQEEVTVAKGKVWRIHYWILRYDTIKECAQVKKTRTAEDKFSVYGDLDDEAWHPNR